MKNLMKIGMAVIVFLSAFAVRANDADFSLKVRSGLGKLVNFTVNDTQNIHVSIYGKDGEVIFEENVKGKDGKISRTYDLAAFPQGKYFLEAENGAKVARYEINLNAETAVVSNKAVAQVAKPVIFKKDGIVTVSIPNADKSPIEIKLYDEYNNEVYNQTVTGKDGYAKKFDISNTSAKSFTLVTKYNDKIFVDTIAAR